MIGIAKIASQTFVLMVGKSTENTPFLPYYVCSAIDLLLFHTDIPGQATNRSQDHNYINRRQS
jgi:hypothetical protein